MGFFAAAAAVGFEHGVAGDGVPPRRLGNDGDLGAVGVAARQRRVDRPARPLRRAPRQRPVAALEPAIRPVGGELLRQPRVRLVRLGHHQQAGRVLVEAVHDARPPHAADARQALPAMGDQGVDQRARGVAGPGMHGQARRLVDDDQVRVLVDHDERHGLRLRRRRLRWRHIYRVGLPGLHPLAQVLHHGPAAQDIAGTDQRLQPRPAEVHQPDCQQPVEALPRLASLDGHLEAPACVVRAHGFRLVRYRGLVEPAASAAAQASLPHSSPDREIRRMLRRPRSEFGDPMDTSQSNEASVCFRSRSPLTYQPSAMLRMPRSSRWPASTKQCAPASRTGPLRVTDRRPRWAADRRPSRAAYLRVGGPNPLAAG